ncbi:syndetin isoform X1 [Callorhinchus milii]|uniref:Coiled-coil domain-containing protein 132 n=1 Tax=Callorhinchus milii TaxID=7868 RepID=V9KB61_CALMI|nr:syndetin isoform X1 [Callorhinchus milii]|eukprot:gi/632974143/ref/XP_007903508.1/ PREDICTED: coiled-coil domain-containing protein 132 [Callorhinchus milii]
MQKIKSLMGRQGLKSPQESVPEIKSPLENFRIPSKEELRELREHPSDPQAEQEIINSIEEIYFSNDSFDVVQYELEKLPLTLNLQDLEEHRDKLKQQQAAVSKKVADLILEKQAAYVKELERVTSLQTNLQLAAVICTNARRQLSIAKEGFTQASLGLLANQRRRQLLIGLLKSLRTIKTLQRTDVRLSEMLEEEDYPGAIQLCLECQKAASTFKHYSCISELNSKLQDTLEQIEEQLDVALSKTCKHFEVGHYTKVQLAYRLLGKTQTAMDQLHMHFTQAIHNTVFQVVLGYVELCAGNSDTKFQKLQYKDLCTHITPDSYIPCLSDLCKALWEVMQSYYRTMEWHDEHDNEESAPASDGRNEIATDDSNFNRSYVKKKLDHGLSRIWQDVQLKAKTYLLGTDLSNFKYDDFIFVLDIISRLMQVGEEFCGSKSEVLQESIRKQSVNYFKNYHRTRLEELRMFLENETWELCPVKSNFSILQLHEFKFMRQSRSPSVSPSKQHTTTSATAESLFAQCRNGGNPFEMQTDIKDDETEDVLASNGYESDELEKSAYQEYDSDSDVPEELKRDYVDEQTGDIPVKSVSKETLRRGKKSDYSLFKGNTLILTNTTLNVIRLVGKYMQMMNILKPIAFDVIHCMSQLFDYYLYAVYTFFGREDMYESTGLGLISSRLRTTLNRIQESLIDLEAPPENTGPLTSVEERKEKVPSPHLSHLVVLNSTEMLYGLAERVVATESLVFLAEQFECLQPHLDAMMPSAKKPFLQQFYSQTVSTASELRKPIYWIVAAKAIDYEQMLHLMANVKWDVKEIMSQHNVYVDSLLKEFEQFNKRLFEVSKRVRIPLQVSNILWEHCIRLANRTIVEGYANVKKCSNEGRALMQLDFQQFLMKLEKLTDIRPIPDKEFVETYIKAYYLTENDMERWIKEHREYSTKQLTNLVNVCLGSHINKKARQKLIAAIEECDRPKR